MLRRFVHYSAPVLANETLWGVGYSLITVIMGHMAASGDLIAAYTVAGSIDKLSTAGIYGIANAAAVIVGKEIGIGSSHESVVRIGKAVCLTAFLFALALGGVELLAFFTLLRPYVLPLFSLSAGAAGDVRGHGVLLRGRDAPPRLFVHDGRGCAARRRRRTRLAAHRQLSPLVHGAAADVPARSCP